VTVHESEFSRSTRRFVRTFVEQTSQRFTAYNNITGSLYFVGAEVAAVLLQNHSHYIIVTEIDWE
jgi:hypothetical protein